MPSSRTLPPRPRIAVLDDWQGVARASAEWAPLEARADVRFYAEPFTSEDAAATALADASIVLAMRERTPFPRRLVDRLPRLAMFGLTGHRAGLIDIAGLIESGVTVCHTEGGPGGESTAELALALLLAAARGIPQADASVRSGHFQEQAPKGIVLAGKTLGLVGLGRIGAMMARYGTALGMHVQAWSPNLTPERAAQAGARAVDKAALFATSDAISIHLVHSPRTRGIIGRAELESMKPGAILVNTARAPLVDEAALEAVVGAGRIVAALDVFDREPLPANHPLAQSRNTVLTPHLGYSVLEVYRVFYMQSVENALAFLDGKPIRVLAPPAA